MKISEVKANPYPFTQSTSRSDLFKLAYLLEEENLQLRQSISVKNKTLDQIKQENKDFILEQKMLDLQRNSLAKLEEKIKEKREKVRKLKNRHLDVKKEVKKSEQLVEESLSKLFESQKRKKEMLSSRKKQEKSLKSNNEVLFQILQNYYENAKEVIEKDESQQN